MSNSISYSLTKTEQGVQLLIQPSATTRAERLGFVIAGVGAAGVLTVLIFGIGVLTVIVSRSIALIILGLATSAIRGHRS